MASNFDQDSFRGRNDDVGLNSATFNGGGGLNTNWTQISDTPFRVRFLIQEAGLGASADTQFRLWYSYNGGSYQALGSGNNYLDSTESGQYTNGATTTQVIGAGTYISGESLGGVETDGNITTGNIDVELNKEFELEWCLAIDGAIVDEADTFDLQVRRGTVVLNTYTRTPRVTVTLPPVPDVVGFLGDVAWANAHATLTQWAGEDYFEIGNVRTHPASIQPYLVQQAASSLRMKTIGGIDGGEFPELTGDTITQTITGLAAARYVYEYYQVSHDDGTRTTRILSGAGLAVVLTITGDEASGQTVWAGPFHHVFTHVGGNLYLEVHYTAPATGALTGIKDTAMLIRRFVGVGSPTLTSSASVLIPGYRPVTLPARSLAMTLEER